MEGAGADLCKVGNHRAVFSTMLDPPYQVVIGGIVFEYHRRMVQVGAFHQHIDGIAREPTVLQLIRPDDKWHLRRLLGHKALDVGEDILAHSVQVLQHLRAIAESLSQVDQQAIYDKARHLAPDLLDGLLALAIQLAGLSHGLVELLLEFGTIGLKAPLGLGIELLIVLSAQDLAVDHGRDRQARLRPDEGKSTLVEIGLQPLVQPLLLFCHVLKKSSPAFLVGLPLKGARDLSLQMAQQVRHHVPQDGRFTGGQPQGPGRARIGKVVHVTPVRRGGLLGGATLQEFPHCRRPSRSRRANGKDVIAAAANIDAKVDGAHSPLLPDNVIQLWELLC